MGQMCGFYVHLEGVHPGGGARHFEVHVTQEVFESLDVAEDGVLAIFAGDQAHGDSGHWCFDRDAGVHQT